MFSCTYFLPIFYLTSLVTKSYSENTAATYLSNIDAIIMRQLEDPTEEDFEDLKDNVDEYIKLLGDLLKTVRRKDPVGLNTAQQYWDKGTPQFFLEEVNGDIYKKLTEECSWSAKEARKLTSLIDKAKFLWMTFETWYNGRSKVFPRY